MGRYPVLAPNGLPESIWVLGAAGTFGAAYAGIMAAARQFTVPSRLEATSAGAVAGVPYLAGLSNEEIRRMAVTAPAQHFTDPVPGDRPRLRWTHTATGLYRGKVVQDWVDGWMQFAGSRTWADFRYRGPGPGNTRSAFRCAC